MLLDQGTCSLYQWELQKGFLGAYGGCRPVEERLQRQSGQNCELALETHCMLPLRKLERARYQRRSSVWEKRFFLLERPDCKYLSPLLTDLACDGWQTPELLHYFQQQSMPRGLTGQP